MIFVHGLDGHHHHSWMHDRNNPDSLWPRWLADDRPDLNVWCLAYPAAATGWRGHGMHLLTVVPGVLDRFTQFGIGRRRLALVGHSMGGVVAKQLLRSAKEAQDSSIKAIAENIAAIAFLATPHTGSDLATLVMRLQQALGSFGLFMRIRHTLTSLRANDVLLENLNDWYRDHAPGLGVATIVYREDKPTRGVMVVDAGSANPGIANIKAIAIARDHIAICKPADRNDQVYVGVRDFVRRNLPPAQEIKSAIPIAPATPSASAAPPVSALPPKRPFFGREAEMAALITAVLDDDRRPLAVLGQAGIGKSALSLQMLHDSAICHRFGFRRYFVRLDTATAARTIWTLVLQAFSELPGPDPAGQALAALAAAPTLLVLDNGETPEYADPGGSAEVFSALASVSSLQLLVTFRGQMAPIGVGWRRATPELQALPPLAAEALFRSIAGSIATDDPDLPVLLGLLGGLPMAIFLLAYQAQGEARVAGLLNDYRTRRVQLAVGEGKDLDLAASIALSLDSPRLDDTARRLFAMAGRLPAGLCNTDAAAIVDGGVAAARALRQIGLAYGAGDRTLLLAPIREQAAAETLSTSDRTTIIAHFLELVAREGPKIGSEGGRAALNRLAPEIANVEAIIALATSPEADRDAASRALSQQAVRAGPGLAEFMRFSGLGLPKTLDATIAAARQKGDLLGEARCTSGLGDIALERSDYATARAAFDQALILFRKVGDLLGEANCIFGLGEIAFRRSDDAAAQAAIDQALPLYQQVGHRLGEANCITCLGFIALSRSDHAAGQAAFDRALLLYRQIGDALGEANCVRNIGEIALARSDYATARACFDQALPLYQRIGTKLGEANCLQGLGDVALSAGEKAAAQQQWQKALALYEAISEPHSIGGVLRRLARVSDEPERAGLVARARAAWLSIDRSDLVSELNQEFVAG